MHKRTLIILLLALTALAPDASAKVPTVGSPFPHHSVSLEPTDPAIEARLEERLLQDVRYRSLRGSWDWRDTTYQLNHGSGLITVASPWYSGVPGLEGLDNEPVDGWTLVVRDFGDAGQAASQLPFFVLYNRYTGVLRFFAYVSNAQLNDHFTSSQVVLRFVNQTTRNLVTKVLREPLSKHDVAQVANVLTPGLQGDDWLYADFEMNYDPTVASVQAPVFVFEIWGCTNSTVDLDGTVDLTLEQVDMSNTDGTSQGTNVIGAFTKAGKWYSGADGIPKKLRDRAGKQNNDAVKDALNRAADLLDKAKWIPFAAAGWSLFDSFFGKKSSKPEPAVYAIDGQLDLTGTIQTDAFIADVLLRVPGADHGSFTNYLPSDYDIPLGVFALDGHSDDPPGQWLQPVGGGLSSTTWSWNLDGNPLSFLVNPHSGVVLESVKAAWAFPAIKAEQLGTWALNHVNNGDWIPTDTSDKYGGNYYQYRTRFFDLDDFHQISAQAPWSAMTYPGWDEVFSSGWTIPAVIKARYSVPGRPSEEEGLYITNYDVVYTSVIPTSWPHVQPNFHAPVQVSGRVLVGGDASAGLSGVTIEEEGQVLAQTDANGDFTFTSNLWVSGTIEPKMAFHTMSPAEIDYAVAGPPIQLADVTATPNVVGDAVADVSWETAGNGSSYWALCPGEDPGSLQFTITFDADSMVTDAFAADLRLASDVSGLIPSDAVSATDDATFGNDYTTTFDFPTPTGCPQGLLRIQYRSAGSGGATVWHDIATHRSGVARFDVDGDGVLELGDVGAFSAAYGLCEGDPAYNTCADIDASGCVNLSDLSKFAIAYNGGCSGTAIEPEVAAALAALRSGGGNPHPGPVESELPIGLAAPRPNPATHATDISFSTATAGPTEVAVYDVNGRVVLTLVSGHQPAGARTVSWNGRDDTGKRVSAGIYFIRLKSPTLDQVRKLTWLQ